MDLDFVSVHKNAKRELGQYPGILTSRLVNNIYILGLFSAPLLIFIAQSLIFFVCSVSLVGHPRLAITPTLGMAFRHHVQRYCSFRVLVTHALIISYHMQGKNIRLGATTYNAFFRDRFFNVQVRFSSLMRTWLRCLLF